MEGQILNFTPHDVTIYKSKNSGNVIATIPRQQGQVLRLLQNEPNMKDPVKVGDTDVPAIEPSEYTGLNFMPPADSSIVVSMLVADYIVTHFPGLCRHVFVPDTSPQGGVRDAGGNIIGTTRLVQYK